MNHPNVKKINFEKLYDEKSNLKSDKQLVEELIKKLNELISKDPQLQKKSALILENWLIKKSKK